MDSAYDVIYDELSKADLGDWLIDDVLSKNAFDFLDNLNKDKVVCVLTTKRKNITDATAINECPVDNLSYYDTCVVKGRTDTCEIMLKIDPAETNDYPIFRISKTIMYKFYLIGTPDYNTYNHEWQCTETRRGEDSGKYEIYKWEKKGCTNCWWNDCSGKVETVDEAIGKLGFLCDECSRCKCGKGTFRFIRGRYRNEPECEIKGEVCGE